MLWVWHQRIKNASKREKFHFYNCPIFKLKRLCTHISLCLGLSLQFWAREKYKPIALFYFFWNCSGLGGGLILSKSAILTVMLNLQLSILCHWTYPTKQPEDKLQYSSLSREQSWAVSNSLVLPSLLLAFIKCLWFSFWPAIVVAVFFSSIFYFPC